MNNPIVNRHAWLQARKKFLEKEKAFTRARDELTRERQALPWFKLEKDAPKFMINSDASIVAPLIFAYVLGL